MQVNLKREPTTLCPSAQPDLEGSMVLGVVEKTPDGPRLAYLDQPVQVTGELLAHTGSILPTEVLRIAAPCVGSGCRHFDGSARVCTLATRVVQLLPPVVDGLPVCHLRPDCRWRLQEGKAACLRCPQVVTDIKSASDLVRRVAEPETPTSPGTQVNVQSPRA